MTITTATNFFVSYRSRLGLAGGMVVALLLGCDQGPEMIPVHGQVFYQDQPLTSGSVMLQPVQGQPARGEIQPDGTFVLSTYAAEDGVVLGKQKVRITCYESQQPASQRQPSSQRVEPMGLGASLIPKKYTSYATSGLVVDIKPGRTEPLLFHLTDE
ncbi:MAG: hypothetical protein GXP26_01285 [Planctomycetes bacterium]|nr:hypothetical protein [Planctomycetota bacterium]